MKPARILWEINLFSCDTRNHRQTEEYTLKFNIHGILSSQHFPFYLFSYPFILYSFSLCYSFPHFFHLFILDFTLFRFIFVCFPSLSRMPLSFFFMFFFPLFLVFYSFHLCCGLSFCCFSSGGTLSSVLLFSLITFPSFSLACPYLLSIYLFLFLPLSSLSGCFIFFLILQFSVSWPFPSLSLVYTFVISWILFLSSLSPVVLLLSSLSIWSLCFSFSLTFFPLFIYLLYRSLPSLAPALIHPHTSSFFNLPLILSSFFFVIKILLFQELMHFLLQV